MLPVACRIGEVPDGLLWGPAAGVRVTGAARVLGIGVCVHQEPAAVGFAVAGGGVVIVGLYAGATGGGMETPGAGAVCVGNGGTGSAPG